METRIFWITGETVHPNSVRRRNVSHISVRGNTTDKKGRKEGEESGDNGKRVPEKEKVVGLLKSRLRWSFELRSR